MTPLLSAVGLSVGYGGRRPRVVAPDLSLSLEEGSFTALLGRNGAGKSTLIRTLCGLQEPLGGEVRLRGWRWPGTPGRPWPASWAWCCPTGPFPGE